MTLELVMPSLGLTMHEGRIIQWFRKEGDRVVEGEPLFELESEKATLEINSPHNGILQKIFVGNNGLANVGDVIALIDDGASDSGKLKIASSAIDKKTNTVSRIALESISPLTAQIENETPESLEQKKASPLARKLAKDAGIDLKKIQGTGLLGTITKEDIEKAINFAQKNLPVETNLAQSLPLAGMRATIAKRMVRSSNETAPVTLCTEADATEFVKMRSFFKEKFKNDDNLCPSYNDLLISVVAKSLVEFPQINVHFVNDSIIQQGDINIGLSVDTLRGLVVPVIKNAGTKKIEEITKITKDLITKARSGNLSFDELTGGTFTITNLGSFGITFFTPIINQPEIAILGVGKISQSIAIVGEGFFIRNTLSLSLTFDHRIIDGAPAAAFLQNIVGKIAGIRSEFFV